MDDVKPKTSFFGEAAILLGLTALLVLMPSRLRHERTILMSRGLSIQMSKSSPPRIAFSEAIKRQQVGTDVLEPRDASQTIHLSEVIESRVPGTIAAYLKSKRLSVAGLLLPRAGAIKILDERRWMRDLPPEQIKRLQEAESRSEVLSQDWSLPSSRQILQEKLDEIQKQTPATMSSSGIYVAAADSEGTWRTQEEAHRNVGVMVNPEESKPAMLSVSGQLQVDAEEPFGPGRHLEVRWFDEGIAKEVGRIDSKNWQYTIQVPEASGTIVAKMIDERGREVSSGQYRLSSRQSRESIVNATIQLTPRSRFAGVYTDVYRNSSANIMSLTSSQKNPQPNVLVTAIAEQGKTDPDGSLQIDSVVEGSWTFVRAESKGFYPALHQLRAGRLKPLPLMPEKMMGALLSLVRQARMSSSDDATGAIIWGQISGPNIEGLQVEIEGHEELRPVYFNELLIPQENQKTTSKNGTFAFVDLPEGFYSMRILRGQKQSGFANIEASEKTVSSLSIAADGAYEKIPVKVFDAFLGAPARATLEFQQLSDAVQIQGLSELSLPQSEDYALIQVSPADEGYLETVQIMNADQDYLDIPLISRTWIESLRQSARISDSQGPGALVGFVTSADYQLRLGHLADDPKDVRIVYFDSQGRVTDHGVMGGGFVVFHLPAGSQTVSIEFEGNDNIQSRVVPIDPAWTQVLQFGI